MRVVDLANAIAPGTEIEVIGIRPGEKLHEVLVSEDEARHTLELEDMYVVEPPAALWFGHGWRDRGKRLPEGYRYTSDGNDQWLDESKIRELVEPFENQTSE